MIEELIENGQYKEALQSLREDTEENRYYRLLCLNRLGEYKKAKEEGHYTLLRASKTYYDVLCEYITTLKETKDFEEAINLLIKELSMPYIPGEYEQILNTAYDEILREKQETSLYSETKDILSNDEIKMLLSRVHENEDLLYLALDQMQNLNVRLFLPEIRQFLQNEKQPDFAKSLLLENLIQQDVDEDLLVLKKGTYYDFNPSIEALCLERSCYQEIGQLLVSALEDDNPTLLENCLDFLEYYLYDIYPRNVYEDEYAIIAATIHYYVASMQSIRITEEDIDLYYHVSLDELDTRLLALNDNE